MCASYLIKKKDRTRTGIITDVRSDDFEQYYDQLIVPRSPAPVLLLDRKVVTVSRMQFSLLPSWSKEPKFQFATHNARIESIFEKPTWKDAFAKRHCLVPLTHFIEPIYDGEFAGHMVGFHSGDEKWLMAAGIWETWVNRATGEVTESFAIITTEPPEYIARMGHDRCPVFVSANHQREWLELQAPPQEMVQFLKSSQDQVDFGAESFRPMRPGWEKRK